MLLAFTVRRTTNCAIVRMNPAQVTQFRSGLGRRAKTDALDADAMTRQLAVGDKAAASSIGLDDPCLEME